MAIIKSTLTRGRRGRPKNPEGTVRWTLSLSESDAAPWEALFHDPIIGRVRQNSRNAIIIALLNTAWSSFKDGNSEVNLSHVHQLMREKLREFEEREITSSNSLEESD
jgi:hypothetical protein